MSKYSKKLYVVIDADSGQIFSDLFYHPPSAHRIIERVKKYYPHKTFKVAWILWDNVRKIIVESEFPGIHLYPGMKSPVLSSGEEGDDKK